MERVVHCFQRDTHPDHRQNSPFPGKYQKLYLRIPFKAINMFIQCISWTNIAKVSNTKFVEKIKFCGGAACVVSAEKIHYINRHVVKLGMCATNEKK